MRTGRLSVLVVVGLAISACRATSSPDGTVRAYMDAVASLDMQKAESHTCAAKRGGSSFSLGLAASLGSDQLKMDFSGLEYRVLSESGDRAVVRASGTMKGTYQGQTISEHTEGELPVVREDGEWRVCPNG